MSVVNAPVIGPVTKYTLFFLNLEPNAHCASRQSCYRSDMRTLDDLRALRQELCDLHMGILFKLIEAYRKAYRLVGYVEGGYDFYSVGTPQLEDSGNSAEKLLLLQNAVKVIEDNLATLNAKRKRMLDAIRDGLALDEEYGADLKQSSTEINRVKGVLKKATAELDLHISQVAAESLAKNNVKSLDDPSLRVMFPIFDYSSRTENATTRPTLRESYYEGIKKGDGQFDLPPFSLPVRSRIPQD